MKTVIFLDVDGVLNGGSTESDKDLDPRYIANFKKLVDITKADVVLSSAWLNFFEVDGDHFYPVSRRGYWLTDTLAEVNITIKELLHKPYDFEKSRGDQIADYLDSHDYDNFIILDDDSPQHDYLVDNWIETDYGGRLPINPEAEGFNDKKLEEALALHYSFT